MSEPSRPKNHLAGETSPYLLQHVHNPVDWYPWSTEALDKAKAENKLLVISIGYAACHWCHVMEHECFEDEEVAALMNERFVSIKVDREERPDIDQIYMDAIQLTGRNGGWPLNAFATPDGRPFYAATYLPKDHWMQALTQLSDIYKKEPQQVEQYADELTGGLNNMNRVQINDPAEYKIQDLHNLFETMKTDFDDKLGGKGSAPKFPMPDNYLFLLRYYHKTGNKEALDHTLLTLDKMAEGGIYDQIGGGFARYSTDSLWKVPHFEKMLYDNAQLLSLYSEAYQLTGKQLYKDVVYDTVGFIKRELTSPEGGFYCALDADSEGVEGKYYVWQEEEIEELLGDDALLFKTHYGVGKLGQWEGSNILIVAQDEAKTAKQFNMTEAELRDKLKPLKAKLLEAREQRIRPGLDDKILCSWNAMTVKGLLDAYKVFLEQDFLKLANNNLSFISSKLFKDGRLYRSYKDGSSKIDGFLEDYAHLINALLTFYEISFSKPHLNLAVGLMQHTVQHFFAEDKGMFYFTSDESEQLITRKIDFADNVIPSPNSVMARNLFRLSIITGHKQYGELAGIMLANVGQNVQKAPTYFANWAMLLCDLVEPFYEVAISGADARQRRLEMEAEYVPNRIFVGDTEPNDDQPLLKGRYQDGQTLIYVCVNRACQLPTEFTAEALKQMRPKHLS